MIWQYPADGSISFHFQIASQTMGMAANLMRRTCVNLASSRSSFMDDIEQSAYFSVCIVDNCNVKPLWNWGWYPGDVTLVLHEAGECLEWDAEDVVGVAWAHLFWPSQDSFSMKMIHFADGSHLTCLLATVLHSQASPAALEQHRRGPDPTPSALLRAVRGPSTQSDHLLSPKGSFTPSNPLSTGGTACGTAHYIKLSGILSCGCMAVPVREQNVMQRVLPAIVYFNHQWSLG